MWEAGKNAGVVASDAGTGAPSFKKTETTPFYDSYEEYSEDLRVMAQDYSIVPEFRISEHMSFYIKNKDGDFLAPNPRILAVTHADRELGKAVPIGEDGTLHDSVNKLINPFTVKFTTNSIPGRAFKLS